MKNSPIWNPINRRNSREWAVQLLFLLDANPPENGLEAAITDFWVQQIRNYEDAEADKRGIIDNLPPDENESENRDLETRALDETKLEEVAPELYRLFAESLVRGVWQNLDSIDERIKKYLHNWTISRIGGVDRSVLRLAFYELFCSEETPPVVIVNEAVDIAKYFSTRESGKFVNGILDRAIKEVSRDPREAEKPVKRRAVRGNAGACDKQIGG